VEGWSACLERVGHSIVRELLKEEERRPGPFTILILGAEVLSTLVWLGDYNSRPFVCSQKINLRCQPSLS
jgi:hypothetical protein